MAPRPPIWEPSRAVDKLPQPFRMIDKLLAEILEKALSQCMAKDQQKRLRQAAKIDTTFEPHAVLLAPGASTCFCAVGVAGLAVAGTSSGALHAYTARDPTACGEDAAHASAVTAMDVGHVAATGAKLVASTSVSHLAIHDVQIKTAELIPLAQVELPKDPLSSEGPSQVLFSPNSAHVAICYSSGAVAVYELQLPKDYYVAARPEASTTIRLPAICQRHGGSLSLVLHLPVAMVKGLLVGSRMLGPSSIVWQLQQRPDKSGKSDRFHKPARGIYIWWKGCNKLALYYLAAHTPGAGLPAAPAAATAMPPSTPPGTTATASAAAAAAATPAATAGAPSSQVQRHPNKGWLLSHGICCSCTTADGIMQAYGLLDGTIVVWDDHLGGHAKILPRMPAAVSALAYVSGAEGHLFCTSVDGSIYVADFDKPENSYLASTKLPHAASKVYFLPNDPFAICVCPGNLSTKQQARFVWYHMLEKKLVAENVGKQGSHDFGAAGILDTTTQPAPQAQAPPPPQPQQHQQQQQQAPTNPSMGATASAVDPLPSSNVSSSGSSEGLSYPRWSFKESYLIAGGQFIKSVSYRPQYDDGEADPEAWPQDAQMFLYKMDALARYLLPEEMASAASKTMLDRMLADLNPPKKKKGKRVQMGIPDPDAPKPPPSAIRKPGPLEINDESEDDDKSSIGSPLRRHIAFDESGDELYNDQFKTEGKKQFKKETRSGGYSTGPSKPLDLSGGIGNRTSIDGTIAGHSILDSRNNGKEPSSSQRMSYSTERSSSPPWHHTNPLARIHPDWEEAQVLARIMDRIGGKGGGRKRRDQRLHKVSKELATRLAKDVGPKPNLLVS